VGRVAVNKAASCKVEHLGFLLHGSSTGHSVTRDLPALVTSLAAAAEQHANYNTAASC